MKCHLKTSDGWTKTIEMEAATDLIIIPFQTRRSPPFAQLESGQVDHESVYTRREFNFVGEAVFTRQGERTIVERWYEER